jgi:hypothetical protein
VDSGIVELSRPVLKPAFPHFDFPLRTMMNPKKGSIFQKRAFVFGKNFPVR